jgi:hypothetical protein
MRTFASTSTLLVMYVASGVLSLGFGSCSSSSSGPGNEVAPDAAVADVAIAKDVVTAADTGSVIDVGVQDTAMPDSGEEGGLCGEPQTMLGSTCDGCIAQNCDATWCACAADPLDAGDGGSGCLHYVKCVEECVADDAGSPTDCLTMLCAIAPFTTPQEQAGHAFLDCLVQYCASDCGQ